jgi:hypothetical protein
VIMMEDDHSMCRMLRCFREHESQAFYKHEMPISSAILLTQINDFQTLVILLATSNCW